MNFSSHGAIVRTGSAGGTSEFFQLDSVRSNNAMWPENTVRRNGGVGFPRRPAVETFRPSSRSTRKCWWSWGCSPNEGTYFGRSAVEILESKPGVYEYADVGVGVVVLGRFFPKQLFLGRFRSSTTRRTSGPSLSAIALSLHGVKCEALSDVEVDPTTGKLTTEGKKK